MKVEIPIVVRPWPALLTVEEAADYVGVSVSTINEWYAEGKIDPHPLPGIRGRAHLEKVVFDKDKLREFVGLGRER